VERSTQVEKKQSQIIVEQPRLEKPRVDQVEAATVREAESRPSGGIHSCRDL